VEPETGSTSCFSTSCSASDYPLSGETRYQKTMAGQPIDGYDLKEEVPFGLDNEFSYIDSESEFQSFCSTYIGYNTCDSWGEARWNEKEREDSGELTSYAFTQDSGATTSSFAVASTSASTGTNSVVTSSDSSGDAVGFSLTTGDGSVDRSAITPTATVSGETKVRIWKDDPSSGVKAGSITTSYSSYYTSQAALWENSSSTPFTIGWTSTGTGTDSTRNSRYAQGSIRDFYVDTSENMIYAVGYNSYGNYNYMSATLFKIDISDSSDWELDSTSLISGAEVTSSSSSYSNTRLTAINANKIAVGEAKLDNGHALNGAYANKLFVTDLTASSPSATFFSQGTGNIGFNGAGGHVNAINDDNDIVGQIDTETAREVDGKPRRKRGFIYPYNDSTNSSRFGSQAWLLDDLTNGGSYSSSNNAYRILSGNDINDAGVIAATAIKCSGGYSATTHDATCSGTEKTVAVKLIPISGATSSDISERGYETSSVSRSGGGSFGILGVFSLFGLAWFRRKK
ncbi:DUF3466 family protein, partial [Vibrio sp.]|nr:DUF3466 family protein [Vibrio sp.]